MVINGPLKGTQYEATLAGDEIVVFSTTDSGCMRAGTVVFAGYVIANKIIGQASFCVGSAPVSTGRMVVAIQDTSTLSATIDGYSSLNFPPVTLERLIRLSHHRPGQTPLSNTGDIHATTYTLDDRRYRKANNT